ncbi:hypothetical protein ASG67_10150 [Sphingomonas sp. Leaf339]|uniref:hypothetical protein n=1 Tax=Sphingomonas sp. Leaf339 TaxID=1736343 RepID=UPI000701DDCA|nr:hypothetical protein [Sphingomonas sp. Leaf339]KQU53174.1 hypothetical protein ASG67_10150 [Sphingomonas sp. Leaf339]
MQEVILPIAALTMLLLLAVQVRKLISQMIVHGTLRRALKTDPESARLLIATLEPESRLSTGLLGWIMVSAGAAIGVAAAFGPADERTSNWQIAAVSVIVGAGVLAYLWWVRRSTTA